MITAAIEFVAQHGAQSAFVAIVAVSLPGYFFLGGEVQ